MRKLLCSAVALASLCTISSAQTITTQTFGTGANAFSIDFVTIGNPGNVADITGYPNPTGSVAYTYNVGKYEVSRDMIDKANLAGSLGITMLDMSSRGGNGANKPAMGISWFEAAKFVNYLNSNLGGAAAYKFDGSGNFQLWSSGDAGYNANNQFRNSLAKFFLPSIGEWYKAAYGSPSGTWYNYPTGSDAIPTAVSGGTIPLSAVYNGQVGPADVTNAGGLSAWGTMAQGGNVYEWIETSEDAINDTSTESRMLRGGGYNLSSSDLVATDFNGNGPQIDMQGFRVAMIPEPSSLSLLALGGVVVALRRRR